MASFLDTIEPFLQKLSQQPESFLVEDPVLAQEAKNAAKLLFDHHEVEGRGPRQLVTEGFDREQIWEEIQLRNAPLLKRVADTITRLLENPDLVRLSVDEDRAGGRGRRVKRRRVEEESEEESDSVVRPQSPKSIKESDQDDSDIDYFEAFSSGSEASQYYKDFFDPMNGPISEKPPGPLLEEDVFLPGSSDESDVEKGMEEKGEEESEGGMEEEVMEEEVEGESVDESGEEPVVIDAAPEDDSALTPFEKQQRKVKAKIEQLEEKAMQDKPWMLRGEVGASGRAQNSLLETFVEFDHATKLPEPITEEVTATLEDLILKRIRDGSFNDVERKEMPTDVPLVASAAGLAQAAMKGETSDIAATTSKRQGLGAIYEEEFEKKAGFTSQAEKANEALRNEIKKLFHHLSTRLDALSNFAFTPHAPAPQLGVVANASAIAQEEVTPGMVAGPSASVLAPEEVAAGQRALTAADSERTPSERKARRRAHKKRQKKAGGTPKEPSHRKKAISAPTAATVPKGSSDFFKTLQATVQADAAGKREPKRKGDGKKGVQYKL